MQTTDFSTGYVHFTLVRSNHFDKVVWAVQIDRPSNDGGISHIDHFVINKANYTLDQLDDLWRAAKRQNECEELIKAIRAATFDNSYASFELFTFKGSDTPTWSFCWPIALEGSDQIAIRKQGIQADGFAKDFLRDLHVKAVCQNSPEGLIAHIEKVLTEYDEVTA